MTAGKTAKQTNQKAEMKTAKQIRTEKSSKPAASKTKPKQTAAERSSLADLFDAADINDASNKLSEGEHEVRLNEIKIIEDEKKGSIAITSFEAIDGDEEGKKAGARYKLTDADGNGAPGMSILKRDLALLGFENVKGKKLLKACEELTEAQPMCIVCVKQNGQYTNVYLQGLAEEAVANTDDDEGDGENEDDANGGEQEVEIGTKVSFIDPDDDDETLEGEVIKFKDDETAIVLVGKKKYTVAGENLTILVADEVASDDEGDDDGATDDDDEKVIEVGSTVTWTNAEDDEVTGEVVKIKGDQATVQDVDGDKTKVDLSELTLVDEDDD
jgi:hypothetical protein